MLKIKNPPFSRWVMRLKCIIRSYPSHEALPSEVVALHGKLRVAGGRSVGNFNPDIRLQAVGTKLRHNLRIPHFHRRGFSIKCLPWNSAEIFNALK